jgi:hypothetical protein
MLAVSLYASFGFEVKEPLLLMRGKPSSDLLQKTTSANARPYVERCTNLIVSTSCVTRRGVFIWLGEPKMPAPTEATRNPNNWR